MIASLRIHTLSEKVSDGRSSQAAITGPYMQSLPLRLNPTDMTLWPI